MRPSPRPGVLIVTWIVTVTAGLCWLAAYGSAEGPRGEAPTERPAFVPATDGRWSAILFVHPRCGCTRSTMRQFERVVGEFAGQLTVSIVFYRPADEPPAWAEGHLRSMAAEMPGVHLIGDPGGLVSASMGARTSGHLMMFDPAGGLRYDGGLTIARGHEGDGPPMAAVHALLHGHGPPVFRSPVFGCVIVGDEGAADGAAR